MLDIFGNYYFYPRWTQDFQSELIAVPVEISGKEVLRFIWPQAGTAAGISFYAALMQPGTLDLASTLGYISFCFSE